MKYSKMLCVRPGQRPHTLSLNVARGRRNKKISVKTWMKHHLFHHLRRETQLRQVHKSSLVQNINKNNHTTIFIIKNKLPAAIGYNSLCSFCR